MNTLSRRLHNLSLQYTDTLKEMSRSTLSKDSVSQMFEDLCNDVVKALSHDMVNAQETIDEVVAKVEALPTTSSSEMAWTYTNIREEGAKRAAEYTYEKLAALYEAKIKVLVDAVEYLTNTMEVLATDSDVDAMAVADDMHKQFRPLVLSYTNTEKGIIDEHAVNDCPYSSEHKEGTECPVCGKA